MFGELLTPFRLYLLPALELVFSLWFLWLPVIAIFGFGYIWLSFKRREFHFNQGSVLLEVKLPREITRSPRAMETVLEAFYQTAGEGTWIDRYIKGQTRAWFSLEIVSIGGQVHFFIWMRKKFKDFIESHIYAQYPTVEIYEVEDYTLPFSSQPDVNSVWGCEYKLSKPDPYPIKTYVDYGLDKDPDEEFKIDPLVSLIEFLGSVKKGQQIWIQIIIRANKKEKRKVGTWFGTTDWREEAKDEIKKLREEGFIKFEGEDRRSPALTEGTKDTISAIERSLGKLAFDVGMRGIYIASKDTFDPINITGLTGFIKAFSSQDLNGFKPARGLTVFDYPWQDYGDIRKNKVKAELMDAYKRRSYFYPPYKEDPFVLTTEELATLFHFPGSIAATPTFGRVPSRKAEAPSNLPI